VVELRVGVVDVFVVDPTPDGLQVLVLRRAPGVRCTGAWEVVHGSIEPGESPAQAAAREVAEETGLDASRMYSIGCTPFYLHRLGVVQIAVGFAAIADSAVFPVLGVEHDAGEWVNIDKALERLAWPRSRQVLRDIEHLLKGGDAGPVEDVLRVF
jgi:8-oxo-dGTP pyrophosphatase MutT (NUDIX family)